MRGQRRASSKRWRLRAEVLGGRITYWTFTEVLLGLLERHLCGGWRRAMLGLRELSRDVNMGRLLVARPRTDGTVWLQSRLGLLSR